MQLSPHFDLDEFTASATAFRRGINNTPNEKSIENIKQLCEQVLEPLRAHFGLPIRVSSGYRSPELCLAIGSTIKSQHTASRMDAAADFSIPGVPLRKIAEYIRDNLVFDQLILEGPPGSNGWIHCSYTHGRKNRKMVGVYDHRGYRWGSLD